MSYRAKVVSQSQKWNHSCFHYFMKATHLIILLLIFSASCSSSGKTAKKTSTHTITKTDEFRGGTSFENAVPIRVEKEKAGVEEEYKWLSLNYPGYTLLRKTPTSNGKKHYDIIKIKTKDSQEKDIYFDTTSFFGKW